MKRKLFYWYLKVRKELIKTNKAPRTTREFKARRLAMHLINAPDSELLICPITFTRYVINDYCKISIVIRQDSVDFYSDTEYKIRFCDKDYFDIKNEFDKAAAQNRQVLEMTLKSRTDEAFNVMYKKVFVK